MVDNNDIIMEAKIAGMGSASDYLSILIDLEELLKKNSVEVSITPAYFSLNALKKSAETTLSHPQSQ